MTGSSLWGWKKEGDVKEDTKKNDVLMALANSNLTENNLVSSIIMLIKQTTSY